ncbi:conserved Plasmodium protein, unknown function [Babesia microti strain RI]|uniref:Uncharacterized protein n=1 Tax=Babesia microti (strain RI) TaxID=1133968 RepID=A0A1R4AA54_BABMR|nr:conserved Plasmodium protein, unknown function [Babesia microti strain RI]SJK85864.1 conserved Plasmodium protein, unknown function [Babesia microti strain RI]|eukprot:XP_021338075.1 conserved Plasmodium protein, unknown function [Babesia microti strain RI]
MWALTNIIVLPFLAWFFAINARISQHIYVVFIHPNRFRSKFDGFELMGKGRQIVSVRRSGKTKVKNKSKNKQVLDANETDDTDDGPIEELDLKKLEEEAKEHIKYIQSEEYQRKLEMERMAEKSDLYLNVFNIRDPIIASDLVGHDIPYGLIPQDRYELMKLYGHMGDPFHPVMTQSITVNLLTQRLFGSRRQLTRDEFYYRLDYKMPFYMPGYGNVFFIDKIRCIRGWYIARGLKQSPEGPNVYQGEFKLLLEDNEYLISDAIRHVNAEINRQGIHPAMIDMIWDFFTDNPSTISRDEVSYKLNYIMDRVRHREDMEGISPDNFYYVFKAEAKERLETFDKKSFIQEQLTALHLEELHKMAVSQNAMVRKRRKILMKAYKEELEELYSVEPPDLYKKYEREKLGEYRNLLGRMKALQLRRKELRMDPDRKRPEKTKPKKELKEKKASRRNKKQGKG